MLKKDRQIRKTRIRSKLAGTSDRPRVSVYRSNRFIYAQAIDDSKGITLVSASEKQAGKGTKKERAVEVGQLLAQKLLDKKITKVVFDRSGYKFHGRVQSLAEGLKEKGVQI